MSFLDRQNLIKHNFSNNWIIHHYPNVIFLNHTIIGYIEVRGLEENYNNWKILSYLFQKMKRKNVEILVLKIYERTKSYWLLFNASDYQWIFYSINAIALQKHEWYISTATGCLNSQIWEQMSSWSYQNTPIHIY